MARSTLKKVLFLGIAFVVIAVSVVLAANWRAMAALYRPTAPPKPVLLNYTNRLHAFSVKFPQYWADSEPSGYIVVFDAPEIEGSDILTSITILSVDLPPELAGETLEGYVAKSEEVLKFNSQNYTRIRLEDSAVSGIPAKILTWSMSDDKYTLVSDQAIFMKDNKIYVITYYSPKEFRDNYLSAFDLVTSTLKFKQSSTPTSNP